MLFFSLIFGRFRGEAKRWQCELHKLPVTNWQISSRLISANALLTADKARPRPGTQPEEETWPQKRPSAQSKDTDAWPALPTAEPAQAPQSPAWGPSTATADLHTPPRVRPVQYTQTALCKRERIKLIRVPAIISLPEVHPQTALEFNSASEACLEHILPFQDPPNNHNVTWPLTESARILWTALDIDTISGKVRSLALMPMSLNEFNCCRMLRLWLLLAQVMTAGAPRRLPRVGGDHLPPTPALSKALQLATSACRKVVQSQMLARRMQGHRRGKNGAHRM